MSVRSAICGRMTRFPGCIVSGDRGPRRISSPLRIASNEILSGRRPQRAAMPSSRSPGSTVTVRTPPIVPQFQPLALPRLGRKGRRSPLRPPAPHSNAACPPRSRTGLRPALAARSAAPSRPAPGWSAGCATGPPCPWPHVGRRDEQLVRFDMLEFHLSYSSKPPQPAPEWRVGGRSGPTIPPTEAGCTPRGPHCACAMGRVPGLQRSGRPGKAGLRHAAAGSQGSDAQLRALAFE